MTETGTSESDVRDIFINNNKPSNTLESTKHKVYHKNKQMFCSRTATLRPVPLAMSKDPTAQTSHLAPAYPSTHAHAPVESHDVPVLPTEEQLHGAHAGEVTFDESIDSGTGPYSFIPHVSHLRPVTPSLHVH